MTIHTLDMPVDTLELARWLERQLVSDRLGALVAELQAAQSVKPAMLPSLNELLGARRGDVLQDGLTTFPEQQLRRLFQYPDRLFELQELVLVHGSSYWNDVPRPASLAASSARNFQALEAQLRKKSVKRSSNPGQPAASVRKTMSRRGWLATTAAATFTVGLGLGWLIPRANPSSPGMAWTRPDAFRPAVNREEFLTRLASLAKEWFDERPSTRTQLANRIIDFRNGCARLQLNVDVIPKPDREWLVSDCRKWSGKLDQHLIALEDGRDMEVVQQEVDQTIQKLIDKLKLKARPS